MSTVSISVVMPARDAAATVGAAVASLRAQDLDDFEIVLVDHGSSDDTHRIMLEQARVDPRIRVLQCRGTFVEAANLAWRSASGDLIARMDSDDIALPSRLRLQKEFLTDHPDLAGCGTRVAILRREDGVRFTAPDGGYLRYERWINSVVSPQSIAAARFIDSPLPNPSTMVRRTVLEAVGGYLDPPWAEDYDLWLRLLEQGYHLGKVEDILLHWHDGPGRATRTNARYSLRRFQEAKAHYLARMTALRELGVVICGAGPTGKEMASLLRDQGVRIHAFIEVNTRQIGNLIAGIPVLDSIQIASFSGRAIMLAAVGRVTGRERIREALEAAGFVEGESFFCVA